MVIPYAERLNRDPQWALREGSLHFEGNGGVQKTLAQITQRLNELGIPYAVCGGMALFRHGYRRFTEDVDLLVTVDGLRAVHDALDGLGYVPPFRGSKGLKDASTGVKIDFLVTGQYPGDGKPKPVAFPEPASASIELDGIMYLALPRLVELKLASGMTGNLMRAKDIADVVELVRSIRMPRTFANELNPYVSAKFLEIWDGVNAYEPPFES